LSEVFSKLQQQQKCMHKELTWGPACGQKHHGRHGTFTAGTPQVVYWAYISEISEL